MNTTDLPPEGLLRWPTDDIVPSPFQDRREFAADALNELADSIKHHKKPLPTLNGIIETGIIQPLTVRRVTADGPLELVCGERRLRAAKLAGQAEVPILLRILNDTEAENIVLTENIQREDLKPSEEARAYDRMLKLRDPATNKLLHTRESVAKIACKPVNYIDDHLKLLACPKELQDAVDREEVTLSVAMVVGRIPDPKLRPVAAAKVMKPDYQQVPMNAAQAKELVRTEFMVSLAKVPWDLDDAGIVPEKYEDVEGSQVRCFGGACSTCPLMSGNIHAAEVKKTEASKEGKGSRREAGGSAGNLCTEPRCYRAKLDAICKQQRRAALEKGLKVLDDDEAKKQFSTSRNAVANGAKYVWLDVEPEYHEVGSLSRSTNGRKWRQLLKGSEVPIVKARNPHTGLLVDMALLKKAKPVGEKALRSRKAPESDKPKSPAELKADEDAKRKRALELRQEKIEKITLTESLNEIRATIERKGAGAELLAKFCEFALKRAGADGCRFLGKHFEIEAPKEGSGWGSEKLIVKKMHDLCEDRVAAWHGMLALVVMSWEISFHALKAEAFKGIMATLGLKVSEIERRAKALFEAGEKSKGKKGDKPQKPSSNNSVDPKNVTVEKVNATTKAADAKAKGEGRRAEGPKPSEPGLPVRCFAANDAEGMVKAMLAAKAEPQTPNENGVFMASQDFKMTVGKQRSFTIRIAAKRMEPDDDFDVGFCTGYGFECGVALRGAGAPKDGYVHGILSAALLDEAEELRRTLKGESSNAAADVRESINEVIRLLKVQTAKDRAVWNAKHNPQDDSDGDGPIMAAAKRAVVGSPRLQELERPAHEAAAEGRAGEVMT